MPDSIKKDICDQPIIGQRLFDTFVTECIKTGKTNIWSTIKKRKLGTWKTNAKKITISTKGKLVELREDRSLFARLLVVCRTRPEIDLKETIGIYELSVVPRSLFAADGTMLRCSRKSALMPILEKLPSAASNGEGINSTPVPTGSQMKVIIIDGMAELQCLDKPEWIHNCAQLAQHFIDTLEQKYGRINEKRVIFDRYDLTMSLKQATREKRQGGKDSVYYKITDSTKISKLPMKRLLSHSKTKMELTAFLAEKAISHFSEQHGSRFVVAWASKCVATHKDVRHLQSSQEEADTKILLHAVDATSDGATEIQLHSPDTNIFVLALRRYPNRREIRLEPIVEALGQARTAALPAFHALSGADNTGSFARHAKPLCWQAFLNIEEDAVRGIRKLGTTPYPTDESMKAIEKFVCQLYIPTTSLISVKNLRWRQPS